MHILLTGANGYIGSYLLLALAEEGHHIIALVRSAYHLNIPPHLQKQVTIIVADLLNPKTLKLIPEKIDAAYYLVHSMGQKSQGFFSDEINSAKNFLKAIEKTECKQIIYLGALASGNKLSEHMSSRLNVEKTLSQGKIPLTTLRAGIIIGAGSASFEIIRNLVEKLPVMIAPKWLKSRCQPIAVDDVIFYLKEVLEKKACFSKSFDIGGPEKLTYHEILLQFAKLRELRRFIIPVPVLTPRLSSYWLFFVTSTSFPLAQALVESLKEDAICKDSSIKEIVPHQCLSYKESLKRVFNEIEQHILTSSWKDALVQSRLSFDLTKYIKVPSHGCLKEVIKYPYIDRERSIKSLWRIGGDNGWYYMNWAWRVRGVLDKLVKGVGLRRGRTHPTRLRNGDVLDFWRVLLAEQDKGHLLLYAEMRMPGEAWLEYQIKDGIVTQTATFRPKGLLGRLYWYGLAPIHHLIFKGLCRKIAQG